MRPTARQRFVQWALDQVGRPALWGAKGIDPRSGQVAFDCSGLVTRALKEVGGPDLTLVDNAQHLFNETLPLPSSMEALPGDLLFFGMTPETVVHVGIVLAGGHALDAAGATSSITDIHEAVRAGATVRTHSSLQYRSHLLGAHRNHWVDALDLVCR